MRVTHRFPRNPTKFGFLPEPDAVQRVIILRPRVCRQTPREGVSRKKI